MAMIAAFKAADLSRALGFKIYVPGRNSKNTSLCVERESSRRCSAMLDRYGERDRRERKPCTKQRQPCVLIFRESCSVVQ